MQQTLQVVFRVLVEPDWIPVDQLLGRAHELVEHYAKITDLHCCDFQGGFFITINGRVWSDEGTVDEFWMTMGWFSALTDLLRGAHVVAIAPWEESQLTLRRDGALLEMEDIHHSGHIALPKVRVVLNDLVMQVLQEGKKFARLVAEIRDDIQERRSNPGRQAKKARIWTEIEANLPDGIDQELKQLETQYLQL